MINNPYQDDEDYRRQALIGALDDGNRGTTDPASSKPTPQPTDDSQNQIASWYHQYLGRDPDPEGVAAHLKNPNGMGGVLATIKNSPEAQAYAARPASPVTSETATSGTTPIGAGSSTATGWGFNSPTGGRAEFQYTPQDYGSDYRGLMGFRDMSTLDQDPNAAGSIKYVFAKATSGLNADDNGVAEVVRRLNAMGIPATQVDPYQIDFGLGEGPMQVRGSDNTWRWFIRDEGAGQPASGGGSVQSGAAPSVTAGNANEAIQALLQQLLKGGYSRDTLMGMLQG